MANTETSYSAEFDTEAEAQAFADKIHAYLQTTPDKTYLQSVQAGGTLRWDIPKRDRVPVDDKDPFGPSMEVGKWKVRLPDYKTRAGMGCVTPQESLKLDSAGQTAYTASKT